jgi:hypothetical protein
MPIIKNVHYISKSILTLDHAKNLQPNSSS